MANSKHGERWLDRIERTGNALPHPVTLFALALLIVMVASQIAAWAGWSVTQPTGDASGESQRVEAKGLLDSDGLWWLFSHLVDNFMAFPPLGVVLVAMLGIGVAERCGLLPALLARAMRVTPARLLTPMVVFLGILSSVTLDAGYVVLPPLAALLFHSAQRSPLAGLAAAFAGVSAGFSANLVLTALDPMLAGLSTTGARIIDADYQVAATANWWFMIASTGVLTAAGWWVTARWIEPRQAANEPAGAAASPHEPDVSGRGLRAALASFTLALGALLGLILVPGAPLHGTGADFARWIEAMVVMLFILFLVPGLAYGIAAGTIRSDRDVANALAGTIADLAPYIVLAFVAAQFIEAFNYSQLGLLIAISGGKALASLALPGPLLALGFLVVAMLANLFIGSASAKYAFLAPVFVPMLMQAGLEPEAAQAAYRVGDSVTNIITPLNPYWVIVLGFMQRWRPDAGMGTLLALMLPYAAAFAVIWSLLLATWLALGIPLGPGT